MLDEKTKTVFFDRDQLFPKIDQQEQQEEEAIEEDDDFKLPSPFSVGVFITVTHFPRCVKIALTDVASDQQELNEYIAKNLTIKVVNACKAPTMGSMIAATPNRFASDQTSKVKSNNNVSATTLLQPANQFSGVAVAESASTANSVQECIARTVGERLILRLQKKQQQEKNNEDDENIVIDKLFLVSCGVGLGAGVNPKDGAEFLNSALNNPMLAASLVNSCLEML